MPLLLQPIGNLFHLVLWFHLALSPLSVLSCPPMGTVLQSAQASHRITQGFVCLSENDIKCVDDVCNDEKHVWTIEVNGNYTDYNSMSKVLPSDKVVLKYAYARGR